MEINSRGSTEDEGMKLDRRQFLHLGLMVGLSAVGAGCAPVVAPPASAPVPSNAVSTGTIATTSTTLLKRGGTLRDVLVFSTTSLDPHLNNVGIGDADLTLLYDSLLRWELVNKERQEFRVAPGLAESYDFIDPLLFELKLRQGVKFHDGSDFNAEVAAWNLERAMTHPKSNVKITLQDVEAVEIIDDYTIHLKLKQPSALLPVQLTTATSQGILIASKQAVESMGEEAFGSNPVGTGPMKFKEWVRDDRLVLERFPEHWEMGADGLPLPYIDEYIGRYITDSATAVTELRADGLDIYRSSDVQVAELVRSEPHLSIQRIIGQFASYPGMYINPKSDTPYLFSNNKQLREAAHYAIDHNAMAQVLAGGMGEAHYYPFWFPGAPGYDESLPRREYDPEKARQLVIEAGYPDGVDLEVKVINRPGDVRPLEMLQAMYEQVGIRLTINKMDRLPWIEDVRAGNYEAASHAFGMRYDPLMTQPTRTGSAQNWSGISDPEMDELWAQASAELDTAKRAELFKQIQTIMYETASFVTAYRVSGGVYVNNRVKDATNPEYHRYIWLDI